MASAAHERRNAAARAQGYRNAYDRRVHDFGRIPPDKPPASGEDLARLRGHRGAGDFEALAASGKIAATAVLPVERDALGRWTVIALITELSDGTTRVYYLRGKNLGRDYLDDLYYDLIDSGADISDVYEVFGSYGMAAAA